MLQTVATMRVSKHKRKKSRIWFFVRAHYKKRNKKRVYVKAHYRTRSCWKLS